MSLSNLENPLQIVQDYISNTQKLLQINASLYGLMVNRQIESNLLKRLQGSPKELLESLEMLQQFTLDPFLINNDESNPKFKSAYYSVTKKIIELKE